MPSRGDLAKTDLNSTFSSRFCRVGIRPVSGCEKSP